MDGAAYTFRIRDAHPDEYAQIGALLVESYASLAGMPRVDEQPEYYALLRDVSRRASNPAFTILVAATARGEVLGSVDFIADVKHYGSGGSASSVPDASGIRLLAVKPECRGMGAGKALTRACIERARQFGRSSVILHTTRAMQTAWTMYERLGFERFAELDFRQGALEVFGFRLRLN